MKIYKMTATFGKLEHATLELKEGLNIINAPNEWGKSTWCAFLVNMLYGIDTRARAKANELPDKERYAPWSGAPMSGRMELNWNGRDITIERRSKGRIPFGEFQAYETATGIEVAELTASNCGEMLLGVERNVFTRAGFLRLSDLPVTQDDALRRRLNNLVSTGDESGAGDQLGKTLKDLKNKCRHNQTGLLPQAERERDQLLNQQDSLYELQQRSQEIHRRQDRLSQLIGDLENHVLALQYEASLADAQQVKQAEAAQQQAEQTLAKQQAVCDTLPSKEAIQEKQRQAQTLLDEQMELQAQISQLPPIPQAPDIPKHYQGIADIVAAARQDLDLHKKLENRRSYQNRGVLIAMLVATLIFIISAVAAYLIPFYASLYLTWGGIALLVTGIVCLVFMLLRTKKFRANMNEIYDRHPGIGVDKWISDAETFAQQAEAYQQQLSAFQAASQALDGKKKALEEKINALTRGATLLQSREQWEQALSQWVALLSAQRDVQQAADHAQALQRMAKVVPPAPRPDQLTLTESETQAQLEAARFEQRQLQLELGQCQGKADSLGKESTIRARLDTLNRRIARLEDTYYALEMAQEALREATTTLQRRFAPRISKRAQELFGKLTDGRYQQITLGEDLSMKACAQGEDNLLPVQWRSDGTIDQLYLALRLAVAEELTPDAPLVLDDALVRFDDKRLSTALSILKDAAKEKQVIVFTCQGREASLAE